MPLATMTWSRRNDAAENPGAVTLSGQASDDAKPYQQKQILRAIEAVDETH